MVEGGDWRIFICRGIRDPLEASWVKNHQTYLPFFLKVFLDHKITVYLDFSKALHKMVDQRENCMQAETGIIGGFTAGRITEPKEGPVEAACPVRFHRLSPHWHFYQLLG